jgi:hypothetical protein
VSPHPQQAAQPIQPSNIQAANSSSSQVGMQDQTSASQNPPTRKQHQNQAVMPILSAAVPALNLQSQPMSSHPLQMPQPPKGHVNPQMPSLSLPQSSQLPNVPSIPMYSSSQPPQLEFLICHCNHHCHHNLDHLQFQLTIISIPHNWGRIWVSNILVLLSIFHSLFFM